MFLLQSLLQWTGKEHPDYNLLLGCKQALRSVLSCCHVILEENMKWEEGQGAGQRSGLSISHLPLKIILNTDDWWFSQVACSITVLILCLIRSCSEAETAGCSANCCKRDQQSRESQQKSTALTWVSPSAGHRRDTRQNTTTGFFCRAKKVAS